MKKEDFLALAAHPDLIPGIYNYCDRWCERCPMTSHCLNYLTLLEDGAFDTGANDIRNEDFWKKIGESFEVAFSMLQDLAEKHNIDLSSTEEEMETYKQEHEAFREKQWHTPISTLANQYLKKGSAWLEASHDLLLQKQEELNASLRMGLPDGQEIQEANSIKDAMEVLFYYIHQILVKLMRAQSGKERNSPFSDEDEFPKDSDGSAKVALKSIDRCIGAWGILHQSFPEEEGTILDMLSMLERLRTMVEKEFPDARTFVRPGFDE